MQMTRLQHPLGGLLLAGQTLVHKALHAWKGNLSAVRTSACQSGIHSTRTVGRTGSQAALGYSSPRDAARSMAVSSNPLYHYSH